MIEGIAIAAIVIGVGTWLRWVSRPAVISVRYVLDLNQNQAHPAPAQAPAQTTTQARLTQRADAGHPATARWYRLADRKPVLAWSGTSATSPA
jgi:hypothetical protein